MIRSYFLIAWRNLFKNKLFSSINIIGLSIGMATFMIITIYISHEMSYDEIWTKKDRIYRYTSKWYRNGELWRLSSTAAPLLKHRLNEISSGIEEVARLHKFPSATSPSVMVSYYQNNNTLETFEEFYVYKAEQSFLEIFDIELLYGKKANALTEMYSVVISESIAKKYFNDVSVDILGKTLVIPHNVPNLDKVESQYVITGIFRDLPQNTHFNLDILLSYKTFSEIYTFKYEYHDRWAQFHTYLYLNENTDPAILQQKIQHYLDTSGANIFEVSLQEYLSNWDSYVYRKVNLQPLDKIYLDNPESREMKAHGNKQNLVFLAFIAAAVIIVSWINYINLSLIKARSRNKEIGIRKVIGANKNALFEQFMIESLLINGISFLLAVNLIVLNIKTFAEIIDKPIKLAIWHQGAASEVLFWISTAILFLFGAFVTGIWPAIRYTSIKPAIILKGTVKGLESGKLKNIHAKNVFALAQYATAYILVTISIVFYQQVEFLRNKELGFEKEQILCVRTPMKDTLNFNKIPVFANQINQRSFVKKTSISSNIPGKSNWFNPGLRRTDTLEYSSSSNFMSVDAEFMELLNCELIAGRNFSESISQDKNSIIINERTLRDLNFKTAEEAIGHEFRLGNDCKGCFRRCIGVIRDYHHNSPKDSHFPMAFIKEGGEITSKNADGSDNIWSFRKFDRSFVSVKLNADNTQKYVNEIRNIWQKIFPEFQMPYFFLDQQYDQQYKSEIRFGKIFLFFTCISIFLACLGFLGMSTHLITRRTKEIGIRKVLGATMKNLLAMLSKNYVILVLISCVIGLPIAFFALQRILQDYAYRIELTPIKFILPFVLLIFFALLSIGGTIIKNAKANPVESLRNE